MKIAIVCDVLGEENNGTTIAAMNLIRYLRERGHQVRVLCSDKSREGQPDYFVVPTMNLGPFNKYVEKNGVSLAKPDEYVIRAAFDGVDIVHIMMPFGLGLAAAKIANNMELPLSAGCHLLAENFTTHLYMQNFNPANKLTYRHFGKLYKQVDSVHYVTPFMRQLYEGLYGITNGYVISNGVTDNFSPAATAPDCNGLIQIAYTGRYSREKSHKVLFEAVAKSKYSHRIQLVLAGDGPLREKFEKLGKNLPIPPKIGFIPREEMPKMLRNTYLYVHAAEIEAEGISCLEAITCGVVPIINDSKRCATKSYALTPENTFTDNDSDDLAAKIDWWIEHRREYLDVRQRYIQMAGDNFARSKCMERMEQMLLETAEKFGKK